MPRVCFIKGTLIHNQMHLIKSLLIHIKYYDSLLNKYQKYTNVYFCVNLTTPHSQHQTYKNRITDLNTKVVYKIWEYVWLWRFVVLQHVITFILRGLATRYSI